MTSVYAKLPTDILPARQRLIPRPIPLDGMAVLAVCERPAGKGIAMEYLWVGIGGFAGANARYIVGIFVGERVSSAFPYGTFLVNLTGSLAIGVILTLLTEVLIADPLWRRLIVIGFLGGFTTFSSYTYESIQLVEQGAWGQALAYILGSNLLGLMACAAGVIAARAIGRIG
jgi:CrcB protein